MTEHLMLVRAAFRDDWPTALVVYRTDLPFGITLVAKRASGTGLTLSETIHWIETARRDYANCRVLIEVTDGPGALLLAEWRRCHADND